MGGSKKQTLGYAYYANWSIGFSKRATEIRKIWYGGRLAWEGLVTESGYIYIWAKNLFGGDKKAGGLMGRCYVSFGREGDVLPDEIKQYHEDPSTCPDYKGILSLHFIDCYVASIVNYVNEIEISAFWKPTDELGDPVKDDSINPISLIYDILTREDSDRWIVKPVKNINKQSFIDAYNREAERSNYVSANFDNDNDVADILADLFSITNTQVTNDGQGNVMIVSLGDVSEAEIESATLFDKDNIKKGSIGDVKISFGNTGIGGKQVVYTKQDEDYTRSYVSRNASDIETQKAITIEKMPLIDNIDTAANIALQDIVKQSANNITANIIVSSSMASLTPQIGQVSKLDLSAIYDNKLADEENYSQIIVTRCVEKSIDLEKEEISLTFSEDVFTRSSAANLSPSEINPPDFTSANRATPLINTLTINAPYFIFEAELLTEEQLSDTSTGYLMSLGEPDPDYTVLSFDIYRSLDLNEYYSDGVGELTFSGVTTGDLTKESDTIQVSFNFAKVEIDNETTKRHIFLLGGKEFIYITVEAGQDIYDIDNVYEIDRGLFDTTPKDFSAGTRLFYISSEQEISSNWGLGDKSYPINLTVGTKLLTRTIQEVLDISEATQEVDVINARHILPLPLAACNINGDHWQHERGVPVDPDLSDGTTVQFFGRNRELERSILASSYYDKQGDAPEINVFYRIVFTDTLSGLTIEKSERMIGQGEFNVLLTYQEEIDTFGYISDSMTVTCKTYKLIDNQEAYSIDSSVIIVSTVIV